MMRSGDGLHDPPAPARITSQKWRAGPGIEPTLRDFRGHGGFAVCCPQGEARIRWASGGCTRNAGMTNTTVAG